MDEQTETSEAALYRLEQQYNYPPALAQACCDEFGFVLYLTSGHLIKFSNAIPINKNWIHITFKKDDKEPIDYCDLRRGIDIRISEIV